MIGDFFELYPKYHHLFASTQLVLAMMSMGLLMRPKDFLELVQEPKVMIVGMLCQLVLIPLLTAGMVALLSLPPEIAVGFIILAALPGGSMSNVYTFVGRANAALSVALTGVMTLLALVTAPVILRLFASGIVPERIEMPAGLVMREIFLYLMLPLAFAMGLGRILPSLTAIALSKWLLGGTVVVITLVAIGSLGSGKIEVGSYGLGIPVIVFLYCLVIQIIVLRGTYHGLRFPLRDSAAISIESCMKNTNLGLLIAASLFSLEGPDAKFGGGALFVVFLYGGVSLIVCAAPAIYNLRDVRRNGGANTDFFEGEANR